MTAIKDAGASRVVELMREAISGEVYGTTIPVPVEDIRALIAEHQRQNAVLNEIKRLVDDGNPHWRLRQELRLLEDTEPPRSPIAARTWDRVHNRPADIYTPPEDRVTPPTDNEREAIIHALDLWDNDPTYTTPDAAWRKAAEYLHAAGFRRQEPHTDEWEYGWRSFFADGVEYEWLACVDREEAERQIRELQKYEDAETDGHLTYSLWRRRIVKAGPWEPVEAARDAS